MRRLRRWRCLQSHFWWHSSDMLSCSPGTIHRRKEKWLFKVVLTSTFMPCPVCLHIVIRHTNANKLNLMKHRNNPKLDSHLSFWYHALISLYRCIIFTFAKKMADIRTGLKWTCFVTRCVTYRSTSKSALHINFQSRNVCPATSLKLCSPQRLHPPRFFLFCESSFSVWYKTLKLW